MEIKSWGNTGEEGSIIFQSCDNMNEVHPADQNQRLSLECCTACTCQPIQSQKAILSQVPTLFLVITSSLLELSTVLARHTSPPSAAGVPAACFVAALMPKVQALSCVLLKHLQSKPPVSHQWSMKGASNHRDTSPIRPHHPASTCPSGRSFRIDE